MELSIKELFDAGVHYGHRTSQWNPKNANFIYGSRNKIHIIDLDKTKSSFELANKAIYQEALAFGTILFVGTKHAARVSIENGAKKCEMPYVSERWLGGMLTNFHTVSKSISKLKNIEEKIQDINFIQKISKKELLVLTRTRDKLRKGLGGISGIEKLPSMVFVIDVAHENIAVSEAVKLGIPVVGIVDTNNHPKGVDYVIPGNDDSLRSIELYVQIIVDTILQAKNDRVQNTIAQEESKIVQ
ncbi:MAG: 30S ribosomal protein S2 [Methylacidiphilales bacterium]|nr:30S ribosomal protein S2 [Candidatus Methylacidiphilales bacterium]